MSAPEIEGVEDERLDALYAVAPEEFTAARNALAKELRAEGKRDEAAAVAKLSRPSAGAWALNQVVRREPALVDELVAAGEAMRGGDDVRAATRRERDAVAAAAAAAREVLAEAGRTKASDTVLATIRTTLEAAAADPGAAAALRRGRLSGALEPPSVTDLLAQMAPRAPAQPQTRAPTRADERAAARQARDDARARVAEARAAAHEAAAEEKRLRREWERAERRAEEAQQRLAAAEDALREAEEALKRR